MKLHPAYIFIFLLLLAACGKSGSGHGNVIELRPIGNTMRYDLTEFRVQPGQEVTIVFENTATSPAMQHNVVVLESHDIVERVGTAALEAGAENDFIPNVPGIIAHTPMSKPGETVRVTFITPETPGAYPYICTFPAHYVTMRGVMIVEEG